MCCGAAAHPSTPVTPWKACHTLLWLVRAALPRAHRIAGRNSSIQVCCCNLLALCSQRSRGSITQVPHHSARLTGSSSADSRARAAAIAMPVIPVCMLVPGRPMPVPGGPFPAADASGMAVACLKPKIYKQLNRRLCCFCFFRLHVQTLPQQLVASAVAGAVAVALQQAGQGC